MRESACMAGFKFNFVLPENGEEEDGHCDCLPPFPPPPPPLQRSQYKLEDLEVSVQPFHEQLLTLLSPTQYPVTLSQPPLPPSSPSPSPSPSLSPTYSENTIQELEIYYVTLNQLKSLLSAGGVAEHDLNLNPGNGVIPRLGSELGPLIGVTDSVHSDLIPEVYEGGMKIWECAYDLVDYLATDDSIPVTGRRVLELGCGIGLPGIYSLVRGAESVHFHDYNHEVLSCFTIPSVLANFRTGRPKLRTGQPELKTSPALRTKFYYGDWADFATSHNASGGNPYDIILTSETIYSASSQPKLLRALKKLTNQNGGVVVMAAKSHYFGVGGSVAMFLELVTRDGHFEASTVKRIEATVPRIILVLRPIRCI